MIREARYAGAPLLGLPLAHAHGYELVDTRGRRYVDCCAGQGAVLLGHAHPEIQAAIAAQLPRYTGPGFVAHDTQRTAAAALDELLPAPLHCAVFTTSGSEAVDLAVRTARAFHGEGSVLAFRGHFHGKTHGAMFLLEHYPQAYGPRPPGYACHAADAGDAAAPLQDEASFVRTLGELPTGQLCAVIAEPVVGYSGPYAPPDWWWPCLRRWCTSHHITLIADEVLCGLHRCGPAFVSAEDAPDILLGGKALANGLPLGAVAVRSAWRDALAAAAPGSTFSDHALSCAAATATLRTLQADAQWPLRAQELEAAFFDAAEEHRDWCAQHGVHAGGRGALLGLRWPDAPHVDAAVVTAALLEKGIAVATPPRRIRFTPPLTLPPERFADVLNSTYAILQRLFRTPA